MCVSFLQNVKDVNLFYYLFLNILSVWTVFENQRKAEKILLKQPLEYNTNLAAEGMFRYFLIKNYFNYFLIHCSFMFLCVFYLRNQIDVQLFLCTDIHTIH